MKCLEHVELRGVGVRGVRASDLVGAMVQGAEERAVTSGTCGLCDIRSGRGVCGTRASCGVSLFLWSFFILIFGKSCVVLYDCCTVCGSIIVCVALPFSHVYSCLLSFQDFLVVLPTSGLGSLTAPTSSSPSSPNLLILLCYNWSWESPSSPF